MNPDALIDTTLHASDWWNPAGVLADFLEDHGDARADRVRFMLKAWDYTAKLKLKRQSAFEERDAAFRTYARTRRDDLALLGMLALNIPVGRKRAYRLISGCFSRKAVPATGLYWCGLIDRQRASDVAAEAERRWVEMSQKDRSEYGTQKWHVHCAATVMFSYQFIFPLYHTIDACDAALSAKRSRKKIDTAVYDDLSQYRGWQTEVIEWLSRELRLWHGSRSSQLS